MVREVSDYDVLEYMASQEGERGLAACRFLVNRILDNAASRGISMLTTDNNWNKEKPKMQCTLEQLRGINWAYIARGRFPNELDTGTMQELVSKCKPVDALIERELNKKWQPLPPMGCEFAYSVNGIIGIVNTDLEREVCQVGKFSALLANELIKRDGSKHIDAKRSMLTYQLEWPCEEVSQ